MEWHRTWSQLFSNTTLVLVLCLRHGSASCLHSLALRERSVSSSVFCRSCGSRFAWGIGRFPSQCLQPSKSTFMFFSLFHPTWQAVMECAAVRAEHLALCSREDAWQLMAHPQRKQQGRWQSSSITKELPVDAAAPSDEKVLLEGHH